MATNKTITPETQCPDTAFNLLPDALVSELRQGIYTHIPLNPPSIVCPGGYKCFSNQQFAIDLYLLKHHKNQNAQDNLIRQVFDVIKAEDVRDIKERLAEMEKARVNTAALPKVLSEDFGDLSKPV